jgi:hypothetical protein
VLRYIYPILRGPPDTAQFQGSKEVCFHPRTGHLGAYHRLRTKCNFTFPQPQSVSINHSQATCMQTIQLQDQNFILLVLHFNRYTLQLQHGDFSWTIKKRYKHIQHLHQQLKLFRASLNIPFPTRAHRERRSSFRTDYHGSKRKSRGALPRYVELLRNRCTHLPVS